MAWNLARYIGRVAEAGKAEYPLPMYVNAALYGFAKAGARTFAAAAARGDVMDVWRAGAPKIDMLSPDIYGEATSWRFAPSTPNPETRCSYPRPGRADRALPGRSTPLDATTPSASRRSASNGRATGQSPI